MAERVELRQVTVPARTLQAAPQKDDVSFKPGWVTRVQIVIPDGHAGITGIAIAQSQQIVIPYSGAVWIIGNDEEPIFPLADALGSGSWQTFTYNTDYANAHTFYLRFTVSDAAPAAIAAPPSPISTDLLELPVSADLSTPGALAGIGAGIAPALEPATAEGPTTADTGTPPSSGSSPAEEQALADLGQVGSAQEIASDATLAADVGLADQPTPGQEEAAPDLSQVEFAVAPPDYGADAP